MKRSEYCRGNIESVFAVPKLELPQMTNVIYFEVYGVNERYSNMVCGRERFRTEVQELEQVLLRLY